jgi:hypothetical protein
VEQIFPKTENGFDGVTKTDVLGIRVTRFAWWQQDLHAIELLRAHIGEWTITRMLDYW